METAGIGIERRVITQRKRAALHQFAAGQQHRAGKRVLVNVEKRSALNADNGGGHPGVIGVRRDADKCHVVLVGRDRSRAGRRRERQRVSARHRDRYRSQHRENGKVGVQLGESRIGQRPESCPRHARYPIISGWIAIEIKTMSSQYVDAVNPITAPT